MRRCDLVVEEKEQEYDDDDNDDNDKGADTVMGRWSFFATLVVFAMVQSSARPSNLVRVLEL